MFLMEKGVATREKEVPNRSLLTPKKEFISGVVVKESKKLLEKKCCCKREKYLRKQVVIIKEDLLQLKVVANKEKRSLQEVI